MATMLPPLANRGPPGQLIPRTFVATGWSNGCMSGLDLTKGTGLLIFLPARTPAIGRQGTTSPAWISPQPVSRTRQPQVRSRQQIAPQPPQSLRSCGRITRPTYIGHHSQSPKPKQQQFLTGVLILRITKKRGSNSPMHEKRHRRPLLYQVLPQAPGLQTMRSLQFKAQRRIICKWRRLITS